MTLKFAANSPDNQLIDFFDPFLYSQSLMSLSSPSQPIPSDGRKNQTVCLIKTAKKGITVHMTMLPRVGKLKIMCLTWHPIRLQRPSLLLSLWTRNQVPYLSHELCCTCVCFGSTFSLLLLLLSCTEKIEPFFQSLHFGPFDRAKCQTQSIPSPHLLCVPLFDVFSSSICYCTEALLLLLTSMGSHLIHASPGPDVTRDGKDFRGRDFRTASIERRI